MCKLQTVPFNGNEIISLEKDGVVYVPVKRLCENLGLDWTGQRKKLTEEPRFNYRLISAVGADKKTREMGCIPFKKLNGWLFSINPSRVRKDLRKKLEAYQEECFDVLYKYWAKKHKRNPNWLEARAQGIDIRKQETDMIQSFVEYAYVQGSNSAGRYYMLLSKECKKLVGYHSERSDASVPHLMDVKSIEKVISVALEELMMQNMFYKDIYKEAVRRVRMIAQYSNFDGTKRLGNN